MSNTIRFNTSEKSKTNQPDRSSRLYLLFHHSMHLKDKIFLTSIKISHFKLTTVKQLFFFISGENEQKENLTRWELCSIIYKKMP